MSSVFTSDWTGSPLTYAGTILASYAAICQVLRFRRARSIERRYGVDAPKRPSLALMTNGEAYEILQQLAELEFPALYEKGLQIALIRTYGIPSISKLLVQTAQLSTNENVAKRYADTTILVSEIYGNRPTTEKGVEAYARLNYLHDHYIRQGRISNDDMLYTLSLFMNHPCQWINRYEWRQLSETEICAIGTFHKGMGDSMKISFDVLPGSRTGWRDGAHFYRELDDWSKQYEVANMVPHHDNYLTTLRTKDLLLSTVPSFTHSLVSQLISAAIDDRLREAVMLEPARQWVKTSLALFMHARRIALRYLTLPRPGWLAVRQLSRDESRDGRRWINNWSTTPHYVKPTFWRRWGPSGWYQLMIGAPRPGDAGMIPEGYVRSNVGPRAFDGKGHDAMAVQKDEVRKTSTRGCPFVAVR